MKIGAKYAVSGALAGFINGFFGAGGGLLLVPLLIRWVKIPERESLATSVFIILPLCASSAVVYLMSGEINLKGALPYFAGGFLGGALSGKLFLKVPPAFLRRLFGALLIYGGVRAVFFS